jgi:hypothetical protein
MKEEGGDTTADNVGAENSIQLENQRKSGVDRPREKGNPKSPRLRRRTPFHHARLLLEVWVHDSEVIRAWLAFDGLVDVREVVRGLGVSGGRVVHVRRAAVGHTIAAWSTARRAHAGIVRRSTGIG